MSYCKDLLRRLRLSLSWVAAQYVLTLGLVLIGLAWTRLPDKHVWQVALTLLVPLHGDEPLLEENLRAFAEQNYPELQLVRGVANADDAALRALVADLEKRHAAESHRRVAVEARLADTREDLARERAARVRVEAGATSLRAELAAIATELRPENEAASWRVDRLSQLYVGGRPTQIAGLRALSEDRGAAAP